MGGFRKAAPRRAPWRRTGRPTCGHSARPLDVTQTELAQRMGVPVGRINQILQEKRALSADTAVRLSRVLGMSAEFWLGLQSDWDLWHAQREVDLRVLRPVPRKVG